MIAIASGDNQAGPANTVLANPPRVVVRDANGTGVPNQPVTFQVIEGGGTIVGSASATTDASGMASAPPWRLGKSNVPQVLRATHGTWSQDITARIQTSYDIEVRFFGSPMNTAQQALFITASQRLEAIITGDVQNVQATDIDLNDFCGIPDQPPMTEVIDDVIVYSSIDSIDGPSNILAQAGYCVFRGPGGGSFPAVGVMMFDEDDLATITGSGSLQDVITHEMLHVLGFGTLWQDKNLLTGAGGPDPRFTGAQARAACQAAGGTITCAASVPVEGNTAPPGTRDGHWRESTFNTEMMTGFIDAPPIAISAITIGSLGDLGYTVNASNNDPYTIFLGPIRAEGSVTALRREGWEKPLDLPKRMIGPDGQITLVAHRRGQ